jgi:hypothetical protein
MVAPFKGGGNVFLWFSTSAGCRLIIGVSGGTHVMIEMACERALNLQCDSGSL